MERAAGTFQDRLYRAAPCGRDHHRRCQPRAGGLPSTLQRPLQGACAGVGSRLSRRGRGDVPGEDPVLQVQAQSRQGQHGQIPLAHSSTAARHGPAELAGAAVDVLEGLDDSLAVQHEGRDIPSQEAPPRPSVLRGFAGRTTHSPIIHQPTNGLGSKWEAKLATLDANHDAEQPVATSGRDHGTSSLWVHGARSPRRCRRPGGRRCRGRSERGCPCVGSRELGIHRDTVKKYMNAESPPVAPSRLTLNGP